MIELSKKYFDNFIYNIQYRNSINRICQVNLNEFHLNFDIWFQNDRLI